MQLVPPELIPGEYSLYTPDNRKREQPEMAKYFIYTKGLQFINLTLFIIFACRNNLVDKNFVSSAY